MLWKTSGTSSSCKGEYDPPPAQILRRLSLDLRGAPKALAGKAHDEKKGSLCDIHESCDTNIKAPSWFVTVALRLLDWLCFCNKNIGFNRLKASLRPVQHFNLLHAFFHVRAWQLHPEVSYACYRL